MEQSSSGAPVGTNILYENLNKRVLRELKGWKSRQARAGFLRRLLSSFGVQGSSGQPVLRPRGGCPICETAAQSAINTLTALFEEIEKGTPDILAAYESSDGVCLRHLRAGLENLSDRHPRAAERLVAIAIERLSTHTALMQEFIRKKNWEYRDETMSPEEWNAWRKALTFYTGYPGDSFTFQVDDG
jgi:hypothetical protein